MKAISIRQPYAFAIVTGFKPVENRSRPHPYRGPVLIHAGKTEEKGHVNSVLATLARQSGETLETWEIRYAREAKFGAIVGEATVTDCVRQHDSPWFHGPVGFVLKGAFQYEPVPWRGEIRTFFDVPESLRDKLRVPGCEKTGELPL